MKKFRKNNKGFSLVELIVVVLIIAIIAVALAPQVIKWVGQARDNTKDNNAATIKSAVLTCVADWQSDNGTTMTAETITINTGSDKISATAGTGTVQLTSSNNGLANLINVALEGFSDANTTYTVKISDKGSVEVTHN